MAKKKKSRYMSITDMYAEKDRGRRRMMGLKSTRKSSAGCLTIVISAFTLVTAIILIF